MALFNEILSGRFHRFSQKHFAMKGRQGTPTLSADVQMGMDYWNGEENLYLQGWDMFGLFIQRGAIAAQVNVLELRNPATSGVIARVTRAVLVDPTPTTAALGGAFQLFRNATADQNTVQTAVAWDGRGRPGSSCTISTNSAAPAAIGGTNVFLQQVVGPAANAPVDCIPPTLAIPLTPGTAISLQQSTVNTAVTFGFWWWERSIEESEKT